MAARDLELNQGLRPPTGLTRPICANKRVSFNIAVARNRAGIRTPEYPGPLEMLAAAFVTIRVCRLAATFSVCQFRHAIQKPAIGPEPTFKAVATGE